MSIDMEEFERVKIGSICDKVCSGGTPKSTISEYYDGNIPWLNTKEVDFNRIDKTERCITELGLNNSSAKWIAANCVIVAMYGATAGKVAISTIPLTTNQACCNLQINPNKADYRYVYYFIKSRYQHLASLANGGAQQNLNAQQIKDFEILLPSLDAQKRIADILWELDSKIELNRKINENLEQQAQAIFKSWFIDFEPFKNGKFVESELGMIPEKLIYKKIEEMPHTLETGKRPSGGVKGIESGVPSIGAENIKGLGCYDYSKTKYVTEKFASTMKKGKIKGYELLIYKDGGKPGYFIPNFAIFGDGYPFDEMCLNEHVFKLDFGNKGYSLFAYFFFKTKQIMSYLNAQGAKAAIPGINSKDIESIMMPSLENECVLNYCDKVENIITHILTLSKESARLATLRDTLLPKLMSGQITL
jgi:type I restriction enzyme S subunit